MRKKILLIEDVQMIKDLLLKEKLPVEVASTGQEGIDLSAALESDSILPGLILPNMAGFKMCIKLEKN